MFKYYYYNNFLNRGRKVSFIEIYFQVKAKHKLLTTTFEDTKEILKNYKNILIVGVAGSGKSTLSKFIFIDSIKNHFKIPIFIELRHLNNSSNTLEILIQNIILNNKVKPSNNIIERCLQKGGFLFILDGYDELYSKAKPKLTWQLEVFMDKYPDNNFIMTTRPSFDIEYLPKFNVFRILELTKIEVLEFISQMVSNQERKTRLLDIIDSEIAFGYFNYLQNPLLLSMFILAFEKHPEIPQKFSSFYNNVFDTLYSQHDGISKGSFPRERKTNLYKEDFEEILRVFCFITYSKGKHTFTKIEIEKTLRKVQLYKPSISFINEHLLYDLVTSISILIKDGFEYKFPHNSMQEFFTASFIANLEFEKKRSAYNLTLSNINSELNPDTILFFWKLCFELDEIGMKKSFFIPKLERMSISDKLNSSSKVEKFLILLDIGISKVGNSSNPNDEIRIAVSTNENWLILYFLD